MTEVNIHQAKTHLSRLLNRVASGEEILIAKAGKPVARLVPLTDQPKPRIAGRDQGLFRVPDDFDAPLPPGLLAEFEK
jgi:prevent-host-death family protein